MPEARYTRAALPRTLFLLLALLLATSTWTSAAAPLRTIGEIRALSPDEAAQGRSASVEALIMFRSPAQRALVAHDGKEGIYVEFPGEPHTELQPGLRVRIEGTTKRGGFLPNLEGSHFTVLGHEPFPEPRRIDADELFSPALDCQWVEVGAIITGVEGEAGTILVAEISGWTVKLLMPENPQARERTAKLMQRPVWVRGVVGSVFNAQRQLTGRHLFVSSFDQIRPAEDFRTDAAPQLRAVDELLRSDATAWSRVRVRGIVTYATRVGLYMRDERGSIFVRAGDTRGLTPGSHIEVEGFAAVAPFRPILRASSITLLERVEPPPPRAFDLSGEQLVSHQAELVSLEAELLAHRESADGGSVLQCRAGRWFFEALLSAEATLPDKLRETDRLRLTGICELTTKEALPFGKNADGFRLLLRTAGDVVILHQAPWWTLERLLYALGTMGVVALLAIVWVALLRRRVAEQTQVIGVQIERSAVKDERQRIARELHDTIEQELAGVSVQLRNARQRMAHAPEQAGTSLELAEKMLRHCRQEAHTSIRDLRSVALEQRGLPGALEEFLSPVVAGGGARLELQMEGKPRPLGGAVDIHLLRIAHEAVVNAARHAAPTLLQVRLEYGAESTTLEIRDDGCGFDPKVPAPRGHFGLLGLQERANKLQAQLHLESTPGVGTLIRVVVPSPPTIGSEPSHPL